MGSVRFPLDFQLLQSISKKQEGGPRRPTTRWEGEDFIGKNPWKNTVATQKSPGFLKKSGFSPKMNWIFQDFPPKSPGWPLKSPGFSQVFFHLLLCDGTWQWKRTRVSTIWWTWCWQVSQVCPIFWGSCGILQRSQKRSFVMSQLSPWWCCAYGRDICPTLLQSSVELHENVGEWVNYDYDITLIWSQKSSEMMKWSMHNLHL